MRSALLLAIAGLAGAVVAVRAAPEISLVLLASEGTLKSLYPFSELPVDLLLVTLGLTLWACVVVTRLHGLPRIPPASVLIIILSSLLVVAAMRSTATARARKKFFFFFFVGVRRGRARSARARAPRCRLHRRRLHRGAGRVSEHGSDPALHVARRKRDRGRAVPGLRRTRSRDVRGHARARSLAPARARGRRRACGRGSARAGSRGVLLLLAGAAVFAGILLIVHARRPLLTFVLIALVGLGAAEAGRAGISPAALSRYEGLTTDPRRAYLPTRALDLMRSPTRSATASARSGSTCPSSTRVRAVPYPHNVAGPRSSTSPASLRSARRRPRRRVAARRRARRTPAGCGVLRGRHGVRAARGVRVRQRQRRPPALDDARPRARSARTRSHAGWLTLRRGWSRSRPGTTSTITGSSARSAPVSAPPATTSRSSRPPEGNAAPGRSRRRPGRTEGEPRTSHGRPAPGRLSGRPRGRRGRLPFPRPGLPAARAATRPRGSPR